MRPDWLVALISGMPLISIVPLRPHGHGAFDQRIGKLKVAFFSCRACVAGNAENVSKVATCWVLRARAQKGAPENGDAHSRCDLMATPTDDRQNGIGM